MKPERLPEEQAQRWRDAQHKVQRAQLEANAARLALEVAQLAVQRLSLDFAEEHGLTLGQSPTDTAADWIMPDGSIVPGAIALARAAAAAGKEA